MIRKLIFAVALNLIPFGFGQSYTFDSEWVSSTNTELTLDTNGIVVATAGLTFFSIDTFSDAATDDVDTITPNSTGQKYVVVTNNNAGRVVTLKDGTGNLALGNDQVLSTPNEDFMWLWYDGANWNPVSTKLSTLATFALDIGTAQTDIITNAGDVTALQTGKLDVQDNKTLLSVDPDNLHTVAMTADITLTNVPNIGGGTLGAGRLNLTSDGLGSPIWSVIIPVNSTYPRFMDNRDGVDAITIEIAPSVSVTATMEPGDQAWCVFNLLEDAWDIEIIKPTDTDVWIVAISDTTTALTTGTAKLTFLAPYAATITGIGASVATAPTGATLIIDVNDGGTSIMTTDKLEIDIGETSTNTAATPPALTDTAIAESAVLTFDIDQIGSTVAGAGAFVYITHTH